MSAIKKRRILAIIATDNTFARHQQRGASVWVGKCIHCNRRLSISEDGTPISFAIPNGCLLDVRSRHPGNLSCPIGRELLDVLEKRLPFRRALFDEFLIHKPFPLDHMRHC